MNVSEKDVKIMVKLQIIHSGEEEHSLSQDLARVLRLEPEDFTDTIVQSSPSQDGQSEFKTSSLIIRARSDPMGAMLSKYKDERYNVRSLSPVHDLYSFSFSFVFFGHLRLLAFISTFDFTQFFIHLLSTTKVFGP